MDHGNGLRTIVLDPRLDRVTRNAVLAHELVHDEFDLLWPPGTPCGLVEKGERFVRAVTAERLVPDEELLPFVRQRESVQMVRALDVAEEFEVPIDVADLALRRLAAGF